jgi:hypothetical protein
MELEQISQARKDVEEAIREILVLLRVGSTINYGPIHLDVSNSLSRELDKRNDIELFSVARALARRFKKYAEAT